ncbi:carbohydrate kinase family protein [Homoserinimonas sp. A447]
MSEIFAEADQDRPAVFIGDIAVDEYFRAESWPRPGDKGTIETTATYVGGSISNAARVHAGFGGATEFISLLNRGPTTTRMLNALDDAGVSYPSMLYDERIADQRNFIFLVEEEHVVLTPDVDDRPMTLSESSLRALAGPGFLYTTLRRARRLRSTGRDAVEVLSYLRQSGRRVVFDLDVDGFTSGDLPLLRNTHTLLMNDRGFQKSFPDAEHEERATRVVQGWLKANGVRLLVRSRASEGVVSYSRGDCISVPGYEVPVVDVTGAGDTLGGALVFALGQGTDLQAALEFAVAAASRSVMHLGPQGGVSSAESVHAFHKQYRDAHLKPLRFQNVQETT